MKRRIISLVVVAMLLTGCGGKYDDFRWDNLNADGESHTHVNFAWGEERGTFFGFSDGSDSTYRIVKGIDGRYE